MPQDSNNSRKSVRMIGHDYEVYERDLVEAKQDFLLKMSGYTSVIETDEFRWLFSDDFLESDFKFVDAAEKIKEDIDNYAPEIDKINEFELSYFDIHSNLPDEFKLKRAYNVDIKNCYLTTALNFFFITPGTFEFCETLKKKSDKHKAFGMLATNYTCFKFTKGELLDVPYTEKNERQRNYFFAVVSEISAVMNQIKSELYSDFLFYWVDGIYFKTAKAAKRAQEILKENNFNSSFDILNQFKMYRDDFRYIIEFKGEKGNKAFTVPKINRDNQKNTRIKNLLKSIPNSISSQKPTIKTHGTITETA